MPQHGVVQILPVTLMCIVCLSMRDVWYLESSLESECLTITMAEACNTDTTQTQPHQISSTQRTENKTTDVVIQQHSRKLLMMDILMSETC